MRIESWFSVHQFEGLGSLWHRDQSFWTMSWTVTYYLWRSVLLRLGLRLRLSSNPVTDWWCLDGFMHVHRPILPTSSRVLFGVVLSPSTDDWGSQIHAFLFRPQICHRNLRYLNSSYRRPRNTAIMPTILVRIVDPAWGSRSRRFREKRKRNG